MDPTRDWLGLLLFETIALVGIVAWNVWAFNTVVSGGAIGTVSTSTPSAFNQSSLSMVHAIFLNRSDEEAKYASGAYRYTDPSL